MELVLVERTFSEPMDLNYLSECGKKSGWCMELHQVKFLHSYLSTDRMRMICVFEAPDAEAVRKANTTAGVPFDRVWTAQEILPHAEGVEGK